MSSRPDTRRVEIVVPARTILGLLAAVGLSWAFLAARDAILLVFVALFLALVLDTPTAWLQRRWRLRRGDAAALMLLLVVVVGGALAALFVTPLVGAVRDLIEDLPQIVERVRESSLFEQLDRRGGLGQELQQRAEALAVELPAKLGDVLMLGGKVFGAGLTLVTLGFMTLFLLVDLPNLSASLRSVLFPQTARRVAGIQGRITHTIGRYAVGAVAIAAIAGAVQGTAAWLLGAPFPLALGILAGVLGLVPQVGATIAAVILALVTLSAGVPEALAMAAVCVGYQQLENVLFAPTIQGKAAEISGFFVIASVVVGASLLGVVGALVAVPLTASIQIVVRELTAARRAAVERAESALALPADDPG
ncbi:MAG: AI-2E family transporter [Thermoleophilia bacterium]|nr:AI-2E family transporter [Thermoleophilia bacterium]